jgi:hypothetical protein
VLGHPTEALALAAEGVACEQMPADKTSRMKAARAELGRQTYMSNMPPTETQLRDLRRLGVVTILANRLEASHLIDTRLREEVRAE